jgi:transcription elongation factor SPT5
MHFFQAIEGLGTLKIGQWNQKMVPVKEMTDVLNVVKDLVQLKPKQWVRMKRGIFKDDLAQVPNAILVLNNFFPRNV